MAQRSNTFKESEFYMTISEFSEFANKEHKHLDPTKISNRSLAHDHNQLLIANFKEIDWKALESGLLHHKGKVTSVDARPFDPSYPWHEYLPRLRKSLRGQHPSDLHGEIWPQKKDNPITKLEWVNSSKRGSKFDNDGSFLGASKKYSLDGRATKVWNTSTNSNLGSNNSDGEHKSPLKNEAIKPKLGGKPSVKQLFQNKSGLK